MAELAARPDPSRHQGASSAAMSAGLLDQSAAHRLPDELVQLVAEYAAAIAKNRVLRYPNTEDLTSYALVSRDWADVVQKEHWRELCLCTGPGHPDAFAGLFDNERRLREVHDLESKIVARDQGEQVRRLLRACAKLRSLRIEAMEGVDEIWHAIEPGVPWLDTLIRLRYETWDVDPALQGEMLHALALLPNLRSLELRLFHTLDVIPGSDMTPPFVSTVKAPDAFFETEHLSLDAGRYHEALMKHLDPEALAAFSLVAPVHSYRQYLEEDVPRFNKLLQLSVEPTFDRRHLGDPRSSELAALEALDAALPRLPHLAHLHVRLANARTDAAASEAEVLAFLQRWGTRVASLAILSTLPDPWESAAGRAWLEQAKGDKVERIEWHKKTARPWILLKLRLRQGGVGWFKFDRTNSTRAVFLL
ncbi:hypothetical protein Rhopal_003341-T1 [Rhodotorula paludigena]|uniref:F-box domain-containing protein n=1 Tax=Rhodotorula paludigena TaxID=86838 RepID=A0AAV5GLH1_9BASI|nr:hypothetical protein Rhopal_003341-T1 [Rhodotorula paludigena]